MTLARVMEPLVDSKTIVCVLPKGVAIDVVRALKDEKKIFAANVNNARGAGTMTHRAFSRQIVSTEREVLTVIVPADRQDELFEFIHERAKIGRLHGGLIFQLAAPSATQFLLPEDVPDEK